MSRRLCCACLCLLMVAGAGPILAGAKGKSSWEQLQQLRPGEKIQVERRGGDTLNVEFGAVTADRLQAVRNRNEQMEIGRTEILRIYRVRPRSSLRAAAPAISTAIGFGAGFGIGYVSTGGKTSMIPQPKAGAVAGVAGAVAGGVIGFVARGKTKELVYTSE